MKKLIVMLGVLLAAAGCDKSSAPSRTTSSGDDSGRLAVRDQQISADQKAAKPNEPKQTPIVQPGGSGTIPPPEKDPPPVEKPKLTQPRMEEEEGEPKEIPPEKDPPIPDSFKPLNKEKTLFFEKDEDGRRRVHLLATVCLREGPLEVLLCKFQTKEHEAILSVDLDARDIHFALIAAGAKPGTTVRFVPEYKPATGDEIKVTLTYFHEGKLTTRPAQQWIQHLRTKKDMEHTWVFAGSRFFKSPDDPQKPPFYCANNGEIISIANFPDSMLDLPVRSSRETAELGFVAHTARIPPLKTKVIITLEAVKK